MRCPSSDTRVTVGGLSKERWYTGKHCGYCGKQRDISRSLAKYSTLSRIFGELSIANDSLPGGCHPKQKARLLRAIKAAQTCLQNEGKVARQLRFDGVPCSELRKGAAISGQLARSQQLVALMGMDHSDVFIAGYDCALSLPAFQ